MGQLFFTIKRNIIRKNLLILLIGSSLPVGCEAFDWGDFHIFAVIFFTFLGGFLGLSAIFAAIYFACGKRFLNNFQKEVAQTHREHHPWPIGSVRWRLQHYIKSARSGETQFPSQRLKEEYISGGGEEQLAQSPIEYTYKQQQANGEELKLASKIYQQEKPLDYSQLRSPSRQLSFAPSTSYLDRPTYFTPTPEKLAPVREEIEEYRIVREESRISGEGGESSNLNINPSYNKEIGEAGLRVIRTTTATHSQKSLRPNTYI